MMLSATNKTKIWQWRCWSLAMVIGLTAVSLLFGLSLVTTGVSVEKDLVDIDNPITTMRRLPRNVTNNASASSIQNNTSYKKNNHLHLLFMFTNVYQNPSLQRQFTVCIRSLFRHLLLPPDKFLTFHFVADHKSKEYAQQQLAPYSQQNLDYVFHDSDEITKQIFSTIVEEMQRRFSSGKKAYYGASIFFLSLGMHRVFPDIKQMIQLDLDIMVQTNIVNLFDEFRHFHSSQIIGLGPEMQPVYRHILHQYRAKHPNTRAGSPLSSGGLPGFNSGVMSLHLQHMRNSQLYNEMFQNATHVELLVNKFGFKGHLGDQDFFTLLSFAHEELFYTLDCSWNYQLCTWWRDVGRMPSKVFDQYHTCHHNSTTQPKIVHGNCDTHIPGSEKYLVGTSYAAGSTSGALKKFVVKRTAAQKTSAAVTGGGHQVVSNATAATHATTTKMKVATMPSEKNKSTAKRLPITDSDVVLHLAVVACGVDRLEETLVMLKSVVMLSRARLEFHIFADNSIRPLLQQELDNWPAVRDGNATVTMYPISLPGVAKQEEWIKLFKPCASQRLFLPYLIHTTDRIIYVDTDTLFLRPLNDLWSFFGDYSENTLATLVPEHEEAWMSWYKRFARHPYVEPLGVNSGVMLMDLKRMRDTGWIDKMALYKANYTSIPWGDQDLINIYFHFEREKLNILSCQWNYRPDHCQYGQTCKATETEGAHVLHGNRLAFHNGSKYQSFRAVYETFESYQFGQDLHTHLLEPLRARLALNESISTRCGKVPNVFLKQLTMLGGR